MVQLPSGQALAPTRSVTFQDLSGFQLDGSITLATPDGETPLILTFANPTTPLLLSGTGSILFGAQAQFPGTATANQLLVTGKPLILGPGITGEMT